MFRLFLKQQLKTLAKWAIRKHQIEIVVVAGWYGTEITRELVYSILHSKYRIRRITKNPWWDFSIPLSILGYSDKQRSLPEWLWLLFKANLRLLMGKPNPHTLVLNINYSNLETAKFWVSFLKPKYLLVTSFRDKLPVLNEIIKKTVENQGMIILNGDESRIWQPLLKDYSRIFTFGTGTEADLSYQMKDLNRVIMSYEGHNYQLQRNLFPGVRNEILAGAVSMGLVKGIEVNEALFSMVKFEMPGRLLKKLKDDLKMAV